MEINKIYNQDCLIGLKTLSDNCIDCCVTSPPYYGLRDYGTARWEGGDEGCAHKKIKSNQSSTLEGGKSTQENASFYKNICDCGAIRIDNQIGLEETPELYVSKMVEVFREVKRVLKKEGTLWLNIGDSYAASGMGGNPAKSKYRKQATNAGSLIAGRKSPINLKPKDLIGIPWMLAFALRADGWYLRQDIIWHKPNPMPESVTDRCTKSHEYIFLLSKSAKYYYDAEAIKLPLVEHSLNVYPFSDGTKKETMHRQRGITKAYIHRGPGDKKLTGHSGNFDAAGNLIGNGMANKRSVWTVTTKPYSEPHFATFPEDLIVDMIKAGCPENGIVLDPFMGAGTTALVASKLDRNYVGFELNEQYVRISQKRLRDHLGMFNKAV